MNKKDLINEYVISTLEYNKLLKKGADYKETNKIALKLEKLDERIYWYKDFPEIYFDILKKESSLYENLMAILHIYDFDSFREIYVKKYRLFWDITDKFLLDDWYSLKKTKIDNNKDKIEKYNQWKSKNIEIHQKIIIEFNEILDSLEKKNYNEDWISSFWDTQNMEQITKHIEKHIWKVSDTFHEIVSDKVHIDVHLVKPEKWRDYYTIITSWMSDKKMNAPQWREDFWYSELIMCLPSNWKLDKDSFEDEKNNWPVMLLKMLARFPHEYNTWLSYKHTVPNWKEEEPYSKDIEMWCVFLTGSMGLISKDFFSLQINDEKNIKFLTVVPVYKEETKLKIAKWWDFLEKKLLDAWITELLDINRINIWAWIS